MAGTVQPLDRGLAIAHALTVPASPQSLAAAGAGWAVRRPTASRTQRHRCIGRDVGGFRVDGP